MSARTVSLAGPRSRIIRSGSGHERLSRMFRIRWRAARGTMALVASATLLVGTTYDIAFADDWSLMYNKFAAGAKLSFAGSAKVTKKVLELTDSSADAEAGAAWALPSVDPAES